MPIGTARFFQRVAEDVQRTEVATFIDRPSDLHDVGRQPRGVDGRGPKRVAEYLAYQAGLLYTLGRLAPLAEFPFSHERSEESCLSRDDGGVTAWNQRHRGGVRHPCR